MTRRLTGYVGTMALIAGACGGSSGSGGGNVSPTATGSAYTITISGLRFSPLNLAVPPGATVTVVNQDGMPHSVTSEPSSGSYTRGAPAGATAFDTGEFSTGQRTFTIAAATAPGTVIPYYCTAHLTTMATPNGTITVDPGAQPAGTTPAAGSSGY